MYIIALDPGETTGAIIVHIEGKNPESGRWEFTPTWAGEITWDNRIEGLRALFERTVDLNVLALVVEDFRLYRHAARSQINSDFKPVQVIGAIQVLADEYGLLDLYVTQPASSRSKVKVLPHHRPIVKGSAHMQDAYRHARYWIVTNAKDYL